MYLLFDRREPSSRAPDSRLLCGLWIFRSDPSLSRQNVTREARRAVDNWKGTATLLSETPDSKESRSGSTCRLSSFGRQGLPGSGRYHQRQHPAGGGRSLNNFVGNMQNAYDQAGVGYGVITRARSRSRSWTGRVFPRSYGPFFIPSDIRSSTSIRHS